MTDRMNFFTEQMCLSKIYIQVPNPNLANLQLVVAHLYGNT